MYALQHYVEVTGDQEFLFTSSAEMLVETARMWYGLGFFSRRREGKFCLNDQRQSLIPINDNYFSRLPHR